MQKLLPLLAYFMLFGVFTAGLTSCKDDEDEPSTATLSFSSASKEVGEGEQGVKINLVLDKPAPTDFIVEYEISGSATRKLGLNNGDFEIVGSAGEVSFAKGETTGFIELNIFQDNTLEAEEKIILTLEDVSSPQIEISDKDRTEIVIAGSSATVNFKNTTLTVNESDPGIHEIEVELSEPSPSDLTIKYSIKSWLNGTEVVDGVAIDELTGSENEQDPYYFDYFIEGTQGELTIEQGETVGKIQLAVYSDFLLEDPETIELTLLSSPGVEPGSNKTMTVTIEQEDGTAVVLLWPEEMEDPENPGTTLAANMDLILWYKDGNATRLFDYSNFNNTDGIELVFISNIVGDILKDEVGTEELELSASYNYRSGNFDPLPFAVLFIDFVDGDFEEEGGEIVREGTYTAANRHDYIATEQNPKIVHSFKYNNNAVFDIGEIDIPDEGSRVRAAEPASFRRVTPGGVFPLRKKPAVLQKISRHAVRK